MKITWIDDIGEALGFASIQLQIFAGSLYAGWLTVLSEDQRVAILAMFGIAPDKAMALIALGFVILTAFSRVVQKVPTEPEA